MKKRISIQYSINESNIAQECYRLLDNTLNRLTSIAATTPPTEAVVNSRTLKEIRGLRDELSDIDIELSDVQAIIDGFLDYEHSNKHVELSDEKEKIDIPDFSNQDDGNIDLNNLAAFLEQIKGATPENFNMEKVSRLSQANESIDTSDIDPEKIRQTAESFKNADLQGLDPQDIFNTLATLQNGSANFDEIGERLKNLKARVDSSEVTD